MSDFRMRPSLTSKGTAIQELAEIQRLMDERDYKEAYERSKALFEYQPTNAQVMWRYAEAVNNYVESFPNDKAHREQRLQCINDGIAAVDKCIESKQEVGMCYTWRAVLGSKWGDMQPLKQKIANSFSIREYSLRASQLNPNDGTTQHVAGAFCYHVANISWVERKIAATLFTTPPEATFEEAVVYLKKADKITPNFIRNALMLGDCYSKMGDKKEAKEWYARCANMKPSMHIEEQQKSECQDKWRKF
eukprot:PhM_4_TR16622/c0_g3_i1/m.9095